MDIKAYQINTTFSDKKKFLILKDRKRYNLKIFI